MKFNSLIAGVFLAFTSVAVTAPAQATQVDFSGANVDMGTIALGQYGTITDIFSTQFALPPNFAGAGVAYGYLPANTKITFSYSFTGLIDGELIGYGTYNYNNGGNVFTGSGYADTSGTTTADGFINSVASTPLVLASANLNVNYPGTSTGTTTIYNNSSSFANFQTLFFGILQGNPRATGVIHYSLSSVPLPAALPLFAAGAAGLFGFGRFRRQRKNVATAA